MRWIALSLLLFAFAGVARAETSQPVETIGQWRLATGLRDNASMLWSAATGTAAKPDFCRGDGREPETFTPAEVAALRDKRAACLILTCKPERGQPPRYEATLLLFGALGLAYDELPRGSPRMRAEVVLRLDDGPLALRVGLVSPIVVQRLPKGSWSLVPFNAAPIERRALERILKSRKAAAMPVNQFFAAYIWVIPFTSAAYSFDLSGGAAALTRLDERCR